MTAKYLTIALLSVSAAFAAPQDDMIYYRDGARIDPVEVYRVLARPGLQRSLRLLSDPSTEPAAVVVPDPAPAATRVVVAAPSVQPVAARPAPRAEPESVALPVRFAFNSAEILPNARGQLDAVVEGIKMLPETRRVLIEGHTDSTGSHEYNLKLSRLRAEAVKQYFVTMHGVDAQRLQTVGFGEERPLGGSDAAAAENRRVQFRGA
jgi:outer membrane protein OmpA-like peptidoglycan-associated protein